MLFKKNCFTCAALSGRTPQPGTKITLNCTIVNLEFPLDSVNRWKNSKEKIVICLSEQLDKIYFCGQCLFSAVFRFHIFHGSMSSTAGAPARNKS
jgi:hypothetical protein